MTGRGKNRTDDIDWQYVDYGSNPQEWVERIVEKWLPVRPLFEYAALCFASPKYMKIANLPIDPLTLKKRLSSDGKKSRFSGETMDEFIQDLSDILKFDAQPLTAIIPNAASAFALAADELIVFTRRCLGHLFDEGAVPVRPQENDEPNDEWIYVDYGSLTEMWIDNILRDWLPLRPKFDYFDIWLASPKYVKILGLPPSLSPGRSSLSQDQDI